MRCHLGRQRRAGQLGNCSLQGTGFEWWAGRSGCVEWNIVTECCSFVSDRGRHCMMAGFTSVLTVHVMLHMASSWLGCPIALPNFSPKFVNSSNPPLSLTGRTRTDGRTDRRGRRTQVSFISSSSVAPALPLPPRRDFDLKQYLVRWTPPTDTVRFSGWTLQETPCRRRRTTLFTFY